MDIKEYVVFKFKKWGRYYKVTNENKVKVTKKWELQELIV